MLLLSPRPSEIVQQVFRGNAHAAAIDQVFDVPVIGVDASDAQPRDVRATRLLGPDMLATGRLRDDRIYLIAIGANDQFWLDPWRHDLRE